MPLKKGSPGNSSEKRKRDIFYCFSSSNELCIWPEEYQSQYCGVGAELSKLGTGMGGRPSL